MPGTSYADGETPHLLEQGARLLLAAQRHGERDTELRAMLKELMVELRSRGVGLRVIGRELGLSPQRVAQITQNDPRIYGPEYMAEQARKEVEA